MGSENGLFSADINFHNSPVFGHVRQIHQKSLIDYSGDRDSPEEQMWVVKGILMH